ncbi:Transcription initiation factor IIA subunit 2 [Aphelenchoides fujianensis]|nr:Transcription initiation factor IIA subunit 2 [Aphelenchoides fujianensis]
MSSIYRYTTLGIALDETLREFVADGAISELLARRILIRFDKSMGRVLNKRTNNLILFKADKLRTYRFVDSVWTLVFEGVELRGVWPAVEQPIGRLKIVACDTALEKRLL